MLLARSSEIGNLGLKLKGDKDSNLIKIREQLLAREMYFVDDIGFQGCHVGHLSKPILCKLSKCILQIRKKMPVAILDT